MEDENKNKYDFLISLLEEGDAMVCLDARLPDVEVPKNHKTNPSLNLIFNLNFKHPLDIQHEGIFTTLSFNGRPAKCSIPFEAVWAIYDPSMKKGQVWEESLPPDVQFQPEEVPNASSDPPKEASKAHKGARPGTARSKKSHSHLRVIK